MKIPENYQTVMPYLIIEGAKKFIDFTAKVFDAKEKMKSMRDNQKVAHAEIMIGESTIMFADATPEYAPSTAGLFVYVEDVDKAYATALEHGAKSIDAVSEKDYGRSCGVTDPFGNTWWITTPNV